MHLLRSLIGFLLPTALLAAKGPKEPSSTFKKFHSSSSPATLDDRTFSELTTIPRDYGFVVCLTALASQFNCQVCQNFDPEWKILASSWKKSDSKGENRMVFGTVDFADAQQTFRSLNLDTAPVVLYYPPTTGPHASSPVAAAPIKFEFSTGQVTAEQVQAWLSKYIASSQNTPRIRRPINYVKIATLTTGILGLITLLFVAWPYLQPVLQSRNLWAAISIIAILLFTSGHMYNHIRGVPYVQPNGRGGITYFAPGFQNQLGIESQIIAGFYGVLSFATISLAVKVPRIQDRKLQQTAVFVWLGVMYGAYAFLVRIFKIKNGGYPYSLPPF